MKIVGLITEYNPFHNGHLYHLNKSKKVTGCDYTVSVMSGNFLQRGEPAFTDKWTRAKMAVDNGVDLVIELPTLYSCQSAEFFAYGAIKLLDSLKVIDYVSFGSEIGNVKDLEKIASILVNEPKEFQSILKENLKKGITFPKARSQALIKYLKIINITINNLEEILNNPNNILGIEYIKALLKINSKIIPTTIKRYKSHYNSKVISSNIASATAIRHNFFQSGSLLSIKNTVPPNTYTILNEYLNKYKSFNTLENYNDILIYLLRTIKKDKLIKILDIEEGLENRIVKCSEKFNEITDIINCISTKRYTTTRIQRILTHILLNIYDESFYYYHNLDSQYFRVLGFNDKGIEILRKIKKTSQVPIINKFANHLNIHSEDLEGMISYDKLATDIYFLGLKDFKDNKSNLDFTISPYKK